MDVDFEGFTLSDAETIKGIYVCSQCEGELVIVPFQWEQELSERFSVVCLDCGDVEQIGRISRTTVAIRNERGIWDYPKVIRILFDLWGELIPTPESREKMIKDLGF